MLNFKSTCISFSALDVGHSLNGVSYIWSLAKLDFLLNLANKSTFLVDMLRPKLLTRRPGEEGLLYTAAG